MIATDIHGKNHHKDGSFRKYINWIDLITGNGEVLRCSKFKNTELFEWTMGGMGLTGVILSIYPIKTCQLCVYKTPSFTC